MWKEVMLVLAGGAVSIVTAYFTSVFERKNRQVDIAAEKAVERLNNLYTPLVKKANFCIEPDAFEPDDSILNEMMNIIEKNEVYASPELNRLFGKIKRIEFEHALSGGFGDRQDRNFYDNRHEELVKQVFTDYNKLLNLAGYGDIKNPPGHSKLKDRFKSIKEYKLDIEDKIYDLRKWLKNKLKRTSRK